MRYAGLPRVSALSMPWVTLPCLVKLGPAQAKIEPTEKGLVGNP